MKIHPEGVEVLKYFGTILLVLLLIVLRFSDLLPRFYGYLIERGMAKYPERSGRRRHKKFAVSKEQIKKQKIAFWCFLSLLCGLTILEWFVIPQPYAMRKDLRTSGRHNLLRRPFDHFPWTGAG